MEPPAGPDVLADPLFAVGSAGQHLSLSMLLARLLTGPDPGDLRDLALEQRGPWYRFFVRCAARGLRGAGLSVEAAGGLDPTALCDHFERELRSAAPAGSWLLFQPDPSLPGFLQAPTPDGTAPGPANNYRLDTASLLTSTIGGKSHERKADVTRTLTAAQVVFALVEYQTCAVYAGRGNYQSQLLGSRSGAGSGVPFMGIAFADDPVQTFRHDVGVLLGGAERSHRVLSGAVWALWAEPWDGKRPLPAGELDPAFIPFARMVRMGAPDPRGRFTTLFFRPTDAGRVQDHTGGGVLGDPFTPLVPDPKTGGPKVRGTLRKGYDYTEVVRLLFGTDEQGGTASPSVQALQDRADWARTDLRVVFEGTAYEQGKTGGFHRRDVFLPTAGGRGFSWFNTPAPLRLAHTAMLERVKKTKSALRGATRILLAGNPAPRDGDAAKVDRGAALLEQRVDAEYLGHLFALAEEADRATTDDWIAPWCDWLEREARSAFRVSLGSVPTSSNQRWERELGAESYLGFKLHDMREGARRDGLQEEPDDWEEDLDSAEETES